VPLVYVPSLLDGGLPTPTAPLEGSTLSTFAGGFNLLLAQGDPADPAPGALSLSLQLLLVGDSDGYNS